METIKRKLTAIESPYAGDVARNMEYLRHAMLDSMWVHGEAPYAMHGLYTRFLDDSIPAERDLGILCGMAWLAQADLVCFYYDLGITSGMREALVFCARNAIRIEFRSLEKWKTGVFIP